MNLLGIKSEKSRTFFTRQASIMLEEFDERGIYTVKEEYIKHKNENISEYYIENYKWYTKEARKHIAIPLEYEFPIWYSLSDEVMLQPTEDTVILKVEIPDEEYILCNFEAWGYRINYWYIPLNDEDEQKHTKELERNGLRSDDQIMLCNKQSFYPLIARKIKDSWTRVFTLLPKDEKEGIVASSWCIKKEWIKEIRKY